MKVKSHNWALFLVLFVFFFSYNITAQQGQDIFARLSKPALSGGNVHLVQDNSIKDLVNLQLTQQKALNGVRGYRISIYLGQGQEARVNANKVRSNFISKYGDENVECHIIFEYPVYKIYVGDFRTKSDAMRFYQKIEKDYPNGFIREDIIAFPE